jgi:hypothetical protein
MLLKILHELLLGFVATQEKFLPGSKGQAAHIAVRHTRCLPNKSDNLQVPLCHSVIVADRRNCLVLSVLFGRRSSRCRNPTTRRSASSFFCRRSDWDGNDFYGMKLTTAADRTCGSVCTGLLPSLQGSRKFFYVPSFVTSPVHTRTISLVAGFHKLTRKCEGSYMELVWNNPNPDRTATWR